MSFRSFTFPKATLEMAKVVFNKNAGSKFISYLPINQFRFLDIYLTSIGMPSLEYAVAFRFDANQQQPIHIDGDNEFRKCSLNFLISGGGEVDFYTCDKEPDVKISSTGIRSYSLSHAKCELLSAHEMTSAFLMTTDIPHCAKQNTATDLLCVRFANNPSFQQVLDAVKSS